MAPAAAEDVVVVDTLDVAKVVSVHFGCDHRWQSLLRAITMVSSVAIGRLSCGLAGDLLLLEVPADNVFLPVFSLLTTAEASEFTRSNDV